MLATGHWKGKRVAWQTVFIAADQQEKTIRKAHWLSFINALGFRKDETFLGANGTSQATEAHWNKEIFRLLILENLLQSFFSLSSSLLLLSFFLLSLFFFFPSSKLEDGPQKGHEAWGCASDSVHLPPIYSVFFHFYISWEEEGRKCSKLVRQSCLFATSKSYVSWGDYFQHKWTAGSTCPTIDLWVAAHLNVFTHQLSPVASLYFRCLCQGTSNLELIFLSKTRLQIRKER